MFKLDIPTQPHILGFLALFSYIVTLLPTILRIVFPQTKETGIPQLLLKKRRLIGILAFFFAFCHGFLLVKQRKIDFLDLETSWIYIQGIGTFIIFTLLAITSNDWSVKRLKKNWKKLHQLTYLAMFLLIWHVLDKMSGHWTYLTPFAIVGLSGITVFFFMRFRIEKGKKQQKKEKISKKEL
ncbi:MAG: ferric reductase-like transmembrane domain-containing protein [Brasilonema octagenarum HA4186-MV1]|jgi:sulfoxide reductase heme-binding subunit YedZ|uniref:Iron reductase n=2 Tax=Brasilonema TaxID=383614 RepID=A0A856MQB3_9CYAN|nr:MULTISPECIES: ferric reductase-like transmembrane domain-containing protein [Brasilonema]MBW4629336.1 ferric reductase-like transmembrane domain-containing protein [Brasilonema octagenarum HA4186-MV1]NMF64173.1 iron reductase [Brasilonema octagenarum UFV-OR1]QDL11791.1 iron reductase [Brasilonema sennae CENA114]QDL18172.1 iron reductase [Brasilonema octagenarum UFV-E1]